jgi:hypothetical protein
VLAHAAQVPALLDELAVAGVCAILQVLRVVQMTVEVDLVEADLEGLSVAVTRLALGRLIAVNTFGGICSWPSICRRCLRW